MSILNAALQALVANLLDALVSLQSGTMSPQPALESSGIRELLDRSIQEYNELFSDSAARKDLSGLVIPKRKPRGNRKI